MTVENYTDNFIKIVFKVLDLFGGIQHKQLSKIQKISYVILYIILVTYFLLACKNFYYLNNSLEKFAETAESSFTYIMFLGKPIINHLNKEQVGIIISERRKYRSQDNYPELKKEINTYQKIFHYFYKGYLTAITLTVSVQILKIFTGSFVYAIWIPDFGKPFFYIIAFCQILTILPCLVNIVGNDLLLIALSTELMIQLKIVSNGMKNLKIDQVKSKEDELECNRKLKKCVKYHIFLLRVLRRVQKVFSPILLYHPILLCLTMCFETYIITECLQDTRLLHLLLKSVLYITSELVEFALYCISAEFVAFEAINIGEALYDSGWHAKYVRAVAQSIPFIIMRSNKEINFTARGLFRVKLRTILQILKLTYSIFALLRTFKKHNGDIY